MNTKLRSGTEYSIDELILIRELSKHLYECAKGTDINPMSLYELLAVQVVIEGRGGPEVEALRRVLTALKACTHHRLTPEFDKLCEFTK